MGATVIVVAVLLGVAILLPTIWALVVLLLSYLSGWRRLSASYAAGTEPEGTRLGGLTGTIGGVAYRNCLIAHVSPAGLFLSVPIFFAIGHKPLFIPWGEIHNQEQVKILWNEVVRFQVGSPPVGRIQLPPKVLEANSPAR